VQIYKLFFNRQRLTKFFILKKLLTILIILFPDAKLIILVLFLQEKENKKIITQHNK